MLYTKINHLIYIALTTLILVSLFQFINLNTQYIQLSNCCVINDIIHDTLVKSASVYDINALIKK
jgi:hypothetical protein